MPLASESFGKMMCMCRISRTPLSSALEYYSEISAVCMGGARRKTTILILPPCTLGQDVVLSLKGFLVNPTKFILKNRTPYVAL